MEGELGFDLVHLQTFYAVARHGTVGRAATVLHRSQPAISHRLKALQEGLGVPLFERIGRRLRLTSHGEQLLTRCEDLFTLARSIGNTIRAGGGEVSGRVRIGTYPTIASYLLVDPVEALLRRHPTLTISMELTLKIDLCESLRYGQLDAALVAGHRHTDGLHAESAGTDTIVAVMSPDHAPRRAGWITPDELRQLRYMAWVGKSDEILDTVHAWAIANALIDDLTPFIPSIDTLRGLAIRGAGFAMLPSYVVRADIASGKLVSLRPQGLDLTAEFLLLTRPNQVVTPAAREVITLLRNLPLGPGTDT